MKSIVGNKFDGCSGRLHGVGRVVRRNLMWWLGVCMNIVMESWSKALEYVVVAVRIVVECVYEVV